MRPLSDAAVRHLARVAEWPDLEGTRYQVLEALGQGGMGTVFLAEDRELHRHVAIKVLRDGVMDGLAIERMVREARTLAQLEHPGIVPVHDLGRLPDGRVYYVMKFVRGTRLDAYRPGESTLLERLRLFERICETVAFAHARGVIHRDLKPQNIMVGEFGEVLVLDWGVAKQLGGCREASAGERDPSIETADSRPLHTTDGASTDSTQTLATAYGTVIGTPAYMAPEQARGELDRVDCRSDIYSLGAILYFLLTGRSPGGAFVDGAVEWIPPRRTDRNISRPLQAICARAMAADSVGRYEGAGSLGQDIGRLLAGAPVSAYRENILERAGRLARSYRAAILLVLAYLAMRILFLIWAGK